MSEVVNAVAQVAVDRIISTFGGDSEGMVRLRGFQAGEISRMLINLEASEFAKKDIVFVVIAEDSWDDVSARHLRDSSKSATWYRNEKRACVFFELDEYSDAQGLRNVVNLTDGNLLGEDRLDTFASLDAFDAVWQLYTSNGAESTPTHLREVVEDLLAVYNDLDKRLALRLWIDFADRVCSNCIGSHFAVDAPNARSAIGAALPALGMFEDAELSKESGSVPRRRRFKSNRLAADDQTPTGKSIERAELARIVKTTTFSAPDGSKLAAKELSKLRQRFDKYLNSYQSSGTLGIDYTHWLALFERTTTRRGPGTKIRLELESEHPDRLAEFDDLDLMEALDDKSVQAAQDFLDEDSGSKTPLVDLLPDRLKKELVRIANPTAKSTEQPLRHLLRLLHAILEETDLEKHDGGTLRLEVRERIGVENNDSLSRALFALLYGPTLDAVARASSQRSWKFEIDESLTNPSPLEDWCKQDDGSTTSDERETHWSDLRLRLRWKQDKSGTAFFEWRVRDLAGFVMLAKLLHAPDVSTWSTPTENFDVWISSAFESGGALGGEPIEPSRELLQNWMSCRADIFARLLERGFDHKALSSYVERWCPLLEQAQNQHVPTGAVDPTISSFLRVDTHRGRDGTPTMLATHPIRLRWVARYLEHMEKLLISTWNGELRLNSDNDGLFFDQLANFSPHEQPSVFADADKIHVSVRENCWHELFEVVKTRDRTLTDWLSDLDDSSLDRIAHSMGLYVDAHPYKADGLHLYFAIREGGARVIYRILNKFLSKRGLTGRRDRMRITLHVACPSTEMGRIARQMEEFVSPEERANSDLPRLRLCFSEWKDNERTPSTNHLQNDSIDIAIVPNLFSATTRCQEQTQKAGKRGGKFHPLFDRTTIREAAGTGIGIRNVSREMLPETADSILESWSTINVRHFRVGMVNPDGGSDATDLIRMSVAVTEGEQFFAAMHEKAQWVITLDAFVGREQIEALEHRPRVVTVQSDLGKGGAYTLIVSSKSGRDFIVHRLTRRIEQQLGKALNIDAGVVASHLYERARGLAPNTLLRSLGLGRVAQELVGLVISRELVSQFDRVTLGHSGFESWISLDEHANWFAGNRNSRADLLRVVGLWRENKLTIELTIVEAKLRTHTSVRKAESQVEATHNLCRDAFGTEIGIEPFDDAQSWRRALLDAIRESTRELEGSGSTFRARIGGKNALRLPAVFAEAIRSGRYDFATLKGVVCSISEEGPEDDVYITDKGYRWIRVSTKEVAELLGRMVSGNSHSSHDPIPELDSLSQDEPEEPMRITNASPPEQLDAKQIPETLEVEPPPRGLSNSDKRRLYQRVLDAFAEYNVEVRAIEDNPISEGPGFYVIRIAPGVGVTPSTIENKLDILKLKLGLTSDLNPRSYIDSGAIVFEVPKRPEERYYVEADEMWRHIDDWPKDTLSIAIGEDVTGSPVWINFSSSDTPHLLVGGITGSGKSVALETVLLGLVRHYTPDQLSLSLVDPKGTELQFIERYPHVDGQIGMFGDEAIELLDTMVAEMDRRYLLLRKQRVKQLADYNRAVSPDLRLPWRLVVLDEFADLTSDKEDKRVIEASLQRLAQKARACGIHVIVATQKPSAEVISSTVRSNLGAQLALRVKTASDSRIIMDETGAEALAGNGDAFLKGAGGIVRLQCAKVRE